MEDLNLRIGGQILSVLWELFPNHPVLLPCFDDPQKHTGAFVSKPLLGREGQNITIRRGGNVLQQTADDFGGQRCIHQEFVQSESFDGFLPQLGVWMVGEKAVALGVRETRELILVSDSPFVPHVVT